MSGSGLSFDVSKLSLGSGLSAGWAWSTGRAVANRSGNANPAWQLVVCMVRLPRRLCVPPSSAYFRLAAQHGFEADFRTDGVFDVVDEVRRGTADELLHAGIEAAAVRVEYLLHAG